MGRLRQMRPISAITGTWKSAERRTGPSHCRAALLPLCHPLSRAGQVQAALRVGPLGSEEERGGAFGRLLERRAEGKGSKRVADLLDEGFRGPLIVLQPLPVRRGARALPSPPSCGFFARTAAMPLCERRVLGEEGD